MQDQSMNKASTLTGSQAMTRGTGTNLMILDMARGASAISSSLAAGNGDGTHSHGSCIPSQPAKRLWGSLYSVNEDESPYEDILPNTHPEAPHLGPHAACLLPCLRADKP
jgi:hypothetical protein